MRDAEFKLLMNKIAEPAPLQAETTAYIAAMSVAPDAARQALINELIFSLKTAGVFAKFDWLCLLAAHNAQAARLNVKNPAKILTEVAAPTFTVDRGYTGDGVASSLNFGETFGPLFVQDSAHMGTWCNQAGAGTGAVYHIAHVQAAGRASIRARADGSTEPYQINDATGSPLRSSTSKIGHRTAVREGAAIKRGYYDGVMTSNLTIASLVLGAGNLQTHNANGLQFSPDRLAVVYTGGALTGAEVSALHSALSAYLGAIGAQ